MKTLFSNQRVSTPKQRKERHLLDVKIRSGKAREQRNQHLFSWICRFILFASLAGGLFYGANEGLRRFVWENPEYRLSEVEIADEGGTLTREDLIQAGGVTLGVNILTVKIAKIRERLLSVPQIETAEVQRVMPNKVAITVTERQPVAWVATKNDEDVASPGGSFLIDSRGVLFQCKKQLPSFFQLPFIYGVQTGGLEPGQSLQSPEIRAALDLVRQNAADALQQGRFHAIGIDVSKGYCLVATDQNHARITFALERIDWQLERLMTLLDQVEQEKHELQTVNLMVQRNIPVTFVQPQPAPVPPADGHAAPAKPEKTQAKNSDHASKTSQTVRQKKPVPVNKPRSGESHWDQDKPVRKALPVNFSNT